MVEPRESQSSPNPASMSIAVRAGFLPGCTFKLALSTLGAVTPSLFALLRACPLRVEFQLNQTGRPQRKTSSAVLGDVAHSALDLAVRQHAWLMDWPQRLDQL